MTIHEIRCEDCGQVRRTSWRNTKLCRECRLLRNLTYEQRSRKCQCGETFLPIKRGDALCGRHQVESPQKVTCAFCHQEDYSVLNDLKVCSTCARDPIHRKQFLRALTTRQQERKDAGDRITV